MAYPYGTRGAPAVGTGAPGLPRTPEIRGELLFDIPGTYLVPVPDNVTTMCAVVRSGSGGAFFNNFSAPTYHASSGGGCGLSYKNDIPVTPGELLLVVVGAAGASTVQTSAPAVTGVTGGESYVRDASVCRASGGVGGAQGVAAAGGAPTAGDGGGIGGTGAFMSTSGTNLFASGGAAAGYSGNGGNGVANTTVGVSAGNDGVGGAGGSAVPGGPSGGVGMLGQGVSGLGGTVATLPTSLAGVGKGGSMGRDGRLSTRRSAGVPLDGAGGSVFFSSNPDLSDGADGAVRLIWGPGRAFPSTDVGQG